MLVIYLVSDLPLPPCYYVLRRALYTKGVR